MRLAERIEEYKTALELFPRCVKCGRDLSKERLTSLRVAGDRTNRFICGTDCTPEELPHVA